MNTLHAIIDPNIFCMFRAGNSRFCTTLLKIQTFFSEFQGSENPPKCPKLWSLDFLGPASEAPGHRSSWRPPRRLLTAKAPPPRRCRCAPQSAAASNLRRLSPGAVGRCGRSRGKRRTLWAAELYPFNRQTNDECFWIQSSKLFKAKKHSEIMSMV